MSGHKAKILLAKSGLDGHWRGISVVARALRDAGFEVIMIGMARDDELIQTAIDEDVDLVGINVGGHVNVVHRIVEGLRKVRPDIPIFMGGSIPPWAKKQLEENDVEVYPPGSQLDDIVAAAERLTAKSG